MASVQMGCQHYTRHCAFISPCCKKVYACRICHDEKETHEINRHLVNQVKCLQCHTAQQASNCCVECGITFGKYFCEICHLYDDDVSKGQFHCEPCGICRVGGRENFFHCSRCDSCLGITLKNSHKCVEKATHSNCPICMEDLHSSREPVDVPRCGHLIHKDCMTAMIKNGQFSCSLCGESLHNMSSVWKALDDEVTNTQMPPEYADFYVQVLCKDCHKESRVQFHVIGLKCQECGSYNTCRTAEPENLDSDSKESGSTTQTTESASTVVVTGPEPPVSQRSQPQTDDSHADDLMNV